jgi:hypothetical protein
MIEKDIQEEAQRKVDSLLDKMNLQINFDEDNYDAGVQGGLTDWGTELFEDGAKWALKNQWISNSIPCTLPNLEQLLVTHVITGCDGKPVRLYHTMIAYEYKELQRTKRFDYWMPIPK